MLKSVGIGSVLMILVVALGVHATFTSQLAMGVDRPPVPWRLLVVALGLPLSLLIHEGGHWIAGTVLGQRCRRFVVWPLDFRRDGGRWGVRPARRGGLVDLVPSTFERFRFQRIVIVIAGPIASTAGAAALTLLSRQTRDPVPFWFLSATVLWLVIGAGNLLPFAIGSIWSDGYNLWHALRGGEVFDRVQRDLLTPASHATPLRPKAWPADLLARLEQVQTDSANRRFQCYLAYVRHMDSGDPDSARPYLHDLASERSADDPPEYALESAWFAAIQERQPETARKWLALDTREVDGEPWVRPRAEAALDLAEGRPAEARKRIETALAALSAAPPSGAHEYEAVLLREMLLRS